MKQVQHAGRKISSSTSILVRMSFFVIVLLSACSKQPSGKKVIVVHTGTSIQAAVDAAEPGSEIRIEPGTYLEAVSIKKNGLHLVGLNSLKNEGVIIKNPGKQADGITVTKCTDFSLENVTVQGFDENGVVLDGVDGFTLSHVRAIDNGEYGLFPVYSSNGVIEYCTASGHSDTGIYVGQSSKVEMRYNTAFSNVNGLEVENSTDVKVTYNNSYNNVAGILVVLLPQLDVKTSSSILVSKNTITDNNHASFALPNQLEDAVPSGIGILVLGSDKTEVTDNVIEGNNFIGVAVFSSLVLSQLQGIPLSAFADIEPNPDNVKIHNNLLAKNGSAPPVLPFPLPGADLIWDGSGTNNCWSNNVFSSAYPSPLPSCP